MWRWYLGLSAAPAVMVGFAHKLLPESARYLSVIGRNDEALKVLEEIARVNRKPHVICLNLEESIGDEEAKAQFKPAPAFEASNGEWRTSAAFRARRAPPRSCARAKRQR